MDSDGTHLMPLAPGVIHIFPNAVGVLIICHVYTKRSLIVFSYFSGILWSSNVTGGL